MARVLGISLAGPRSYDGQPHDFPFVNPQGRKNACAKDIDTATAVLWRVWAVMLGLTLLIALI